MLLDLKLPMVDGLEVLRRIRQRPAHAPRPGRRADLVERGARHRRELQLGVNSYIVKPVDFEQFTEAMRTLNLYWLLLNRSPSGGAPTPQAPPTP